MARPAAVGVLVAVVIAWTGPWSPLTDITLFSAAVEATSSVTDKTTEVAVSWTPFVASTSILASWLLILLFLRPGRRQLGDVFPRSVGQIWGAHLVGVFVFGLDFVFNISGMAGSMAFGFSHAGTFFVLLAPVLGWIAVALSRSNTASNAVFGQFQLLVGRLVGAPPLIFSSLNSVGAEVGKPVAPQTASVGVSTTDYVRDEGEVIKHNMPWTLFVLAYLIAVGCLFYFLLPGTMT